MMAKNTTLETRNHAHALLSIASLPAPNVIINSIKSHLSDWIESKWACKSSCSAREGFVEVGSHAAVAVCYHNKASRRENPMKGSRFDWNYRTGDEWHSWWLWCLLNVPSPVNLFSLLSRWDVDSPLQWITFPFLGQQVAINERTWTSSFLCNRHVSSIWNFYWQHEAAWWLIEQQTINRLNTSPLIIRSHQATNFSIHASFSANFPFDNSIISEHD